MRGARRRSGPPDLALEGARVGSRAGAVPIPRSRLLAADVLRVSSVGLRTRRLRAALSAIGVAIGIAALVAVLGISESSRAGLLAELNRLGTTCSRFSQARPSSAKTPSCPNRPAGPYGTCAACARRPA